MPNEVLYAAAAVASYLLGAIPFGFVVYRLRTGKDVRSVGSGNIGATNIGRELGFRYFALVLILDCLKGFLPTLGAFYLAELFPCPVCSKAMLPVFCGLMAFLGHIFPVYLRFKGGKGVATGLGVALALNWAAALIAVGVFAAALLALRIVALGSILGALALPVAHGFLDPERFAYDRVPVLVFFALGAVFIVVRHIPNLRRLMRGEEPRVLAGKP